MDRPERDEDLARRAADGDDTAFEDLVRRHQDRVYRLCLRIMGNPDDAHDAAQDAFVSLLRKVHQFRGDAAFTTWLHRVCVNACYDSLRARKRRPNLHVVDEDGPEIELGDRVADHAQDVSGAVDIGRALATIAEEYRVTLVLADVQDLPYEEIATILEVPVGTVKSRVHRGRVALARALGLAADAASVSAEGEPPGGSQTSDGAS